MEEKKGDTALGRIAFFLWQMTVDELVLRLTIQNDAAGPLRDATRLIGAMADAADRASQRGRSAFAGLRVGITAAADASRRLANELVDFGADSIKELAGFRKEMAEVGKTTGIAGDELKALGKDLRDLSLDELRGNVAAKDLSDIAAAAGQLGVGKADMLDFTKNVAELSKALDLTADSTATNMAKIANQFRDSLEKPRMYFDEFGQAVGEGTKSAYSQLANLGSVVNELSNTTTATAESIINMTQRMAGTGAAIKLTSDQVMALSATMTDAGLGVERGSTAMNKMMSELYKNSDSFAKTLHLNAAELADALQKDPMKAIEMVLKGMDTMKKTEGPKELLLAVESLLGKGDGITQLALNLSSKYADLGKNAGVAAEAFRTGVSAHNEFMAQTNHTAARWEALTAKVNEFKMRLAEGIEPLTNTVTEWLNTGADWILSGFDAKMDAAVSWFAQKGFEIKSGFVAMFGQETLDQLLRWDFGGAAASIVGQISGAIQAAVMSSPFAPLLGSAAAAKDGILREFFIIKDSIAQAISQIASGDYSAAWQTLELSAKLSVANIIETLKGIGMGVWESLSNLSSGGVFQGLTDELATLGGHIAGVVTAGKDFVVWFEKIGGFDAIGVTVVAGVEAIVEAVNKAIEGFKQLGTFIGEWIAGEFSLSDIFAPLGDVNQWIKDWTYNSITVPVNEWWNSLWDSLYASMREKIEGMVGWIGEQFDKIKALADKLPFVGGNNEFDTQASIESLMSLRTQMGSLFSENAALTQEYNAVFKGLAAAIQEGAAPTDDLTARFTALIAEMQRIEEVGWKNSVFPDLRSQLDLSQGSAGELNQAFADTGGVLAKMGTDLQASAASASSAFAALNDQQQKVNWIGENYKAIQAELTAYEEELKYLSIETAKYREELQRTSDAESDKRANIQATINALDAKKIALQTGQLAVKADAETTQAWLQQEKSALTQVQAAHEAAARAYKKQEDEYKGMLTGLSDASKAWIFSSDSVSSAFEKMGLEMTDASAKIFEQEQATWKSKTAMDEKIAAINALAAQETGLASVTAQTTAEINKQATALTSLAGVTITRSRNVDTSAPDYAQKLADYNAMAAQKTRSDMANQGFGTSVSMEDYLTSLGRSDLLDFVFKHNGGSITPRRFHRGGLAPDEVPAILQTGEYVLSRQDVRRIRSGDASPINKVRKFHDGGGVPPVAGGSAGVHITLNLDGKMIFNEVVKDSRTLNAFVRQMTITQNAQKTIRIG